MPKKTQSVQTDPPRVKKTRKITKIKYVHSREQMNREKPVVVEQRSYLRPRTTYQDLDKSQKEEGTQTKLQDYLQHYKTMTLQQQQQLEEQCMMEEINKLPLLSLSNPINIGYFNLDRSLSCNLCHTNTRMETAFAVSKHTESQLHRTEIQLYLARGLIADLQKQLQVKQQSAILPSRTMIQDQIQRPPIPPPLQTVIYTNQTNAAQTRQRTKQVITQIQSPPSRVEQVEEAVIDTNDVQMIPQSTEIEQQNIPPAHFHRPARDNREYLQSYGQIKWVENPWLNEIQKFTHNRSPNAQDNSENLSALHERLIELFFNRSLFPKLQQIIKSDKYKYMMKMFASVLLANPNCTLKEIEHKYLWQEVKYSKPRKPLFKAILDALEFPVQVMENDSMHHYAISKQSRQSAPKHENWTVEQLKKVWKYYYCAHPYLRMMFIMMLTIGLRQEDLFAIKTPDFEMAIRENERKELVLTEGKVRTIGITNLRHYYFTDSIAKRLRDDYIQLQALAKKAKVEHHYVFGPHRVQAKVIQFIRSQPVRFDQVKRKRQTLVIPLELDELKSFTLMHNFRTTCTNQISNVMPRDDVKAFMGWRNQKEAIIYYDRVKNGNYYQKIAKLIEPELAIHQYETLDQLEPHVESIRKHTERYILRAANHEKDPLFGCQQDLDYHDDRKTLMQIVKRQRQAALKAAKINKRGTRKVAKKAN